MTTLTQPIPVEFIHESAIQEALARIAPLWPLRHFVAVNPYMGMLHLPFDKACSLLHRVTGYAPLQTPEEYLKAWQSGVISKEHINAAVDEQWPADRLLAVLHEATSAPPAVHLQTVADFLDNKDAHAHWSVFIVEEISKWCGTYFDENQTTWASPWKQDGLFASWRDAALYDRNPQTFGLNNFREIVHALPADARSCIQVCLHRIAPPGLPLVDFLHRQLASISGWAGYAQYLAREAKMRGQANDTLLDLLAIRLAYDAALFNAFVPEGMERTQWLAQSASHGQDDVLSALVRWQYAYEVGYQHRLVRQLAPRTAKSQTDRPRLQAIFCIDVRSEVLRRHLEASESGVQTLGFAGFFGFPLAHRTTTSTRDEARCPVLLLPAVKTCTDTGSAAVKRLANEGAWKAFQNSAASCFSFVETIGIGFSMALGRKQCQADAYGHQCVQPTVVDGDSKNLETVATMAATALRNMSLTKNFARIVLVCGHGSQSSNNPHATGLDCGACGGHAGDVNARYCASVLNHPEVRALLKKQSLSIPDDTVFIAGLHNTTTDTVILFDSEHIPHTHTDDIALLRNSLDNASVLTRRERAQRLGLPKMDDAQLLQSLRNRAADVAQVRPEWGLANCAALIAAPRSRTLGLNLEGRVFLHDYDYNADSQLSVLSLILNAPVVVASWINLQYYASRVNPMIHGSGNKVLHNVVGGLGVLEGNSGDLRAGLPYQSIHNGKEWMHEPRRLSVFVEAPREAIQCVIEQKSELAQLFNHSWIHLFAMEASTVYRYRNNTWVREYHD